MDPYTTERQLKEAINERNRATEELARRDERDQSIRHTIRRYWIYIVVTMAILFVSLSLLRVVNGEVTRWTKVRNANNQISVAQKEAQVAYAQVEREEARAEIRIAEAEGIAESQKIIDSSLTPTYLTYEAIKAQASLAESDNATFIYIPVGDQGIPLVSTSPSPSIGGNDD